MTQTQLFPIKSLNQLIIPLQETLSSIALQIDAKTDKLMLVL